MKATSTAPRWQRLEHDERRQQILACARKLFSERNYAAVSTSDIAREAGVARGLLHHYFGTKRELYLEVIRAMMRMPSNPVPLQSPGRGLEVVIADSVDRWMQMIERNRGTWLAAIGAGGLGRDPEAEAIMDEARERAADRLIDALQTYEADDAPPELRAAIRSYSGFAEAASIQWLERGRLSREQTKVLLVEGFLSIVRDVLPAVQRAAPSGEAHPHAHGHGHGHGHDDAEGDGDADGHDDAGADGHGHGHGHGHGQDDGRADGHGSGRDHHDGRADGGVL